MPTFHQSLTYGKCIGANYTDVSKGMCAEEFRAFKECVQASYIMASNQSGEPCAHTKYGLDRLAESDGQEVVASGLSNNCIQVYGRMTVL